ncbi:cell division protein FtsH [Candidatus Jorgensenbacteria bacterium RIFCSPLOWO2_01_FULL_45_25b]|uniref:ATP-dependent zinc metalloprotease FtsH n=1 Tax=Candidatus Jorgensenbacteria bacterium RIFCSPLOWO2_01_FULL_45_25b TaxID=1798471 RepID=A0A1F6BWK9_9BACT|nr:MAG: cell division protein FtsH [Candidatus Jorgensenbacteria bacterium RIFCSPLOWO2_01_FULL_45_25b]
MKHLSKHILWAVVSLISIALVFSAFFGEQASKPKKLSLNELVSSINEGGIKSIAVLGDTLNIVLKDEAKAVAKKEAEAGLTQTLFNYGVLPEKLSAVQISIQDESGFRYWMGIIIPSLLPVLLLILLFGWFFRQAKGGMNQAFTFGKANLKLFSAHKGRVSFKDVAGLKEPKEELEEIVDFLKNPNKFLDMGARIPRGVLLVGQPGTGKTLMARAIAGESNVPFFHMSASEFVEMFVGVGASRVRDLFQVAKRAAPSLVFIDEIDAVGRERGAGLGGGHDEREQTLNQILVEMDGFERETNVIVIAATNRPDVLDSALLRPGRFDRRIVMDMPDIQDRDEILQIHAKGKPLAKEVSLHAVAVRTPGFAGADLANLLNEAAILAARHGKKEISQHDIMNSIEKVLLGPTRTSRKITDHEKKVTAYHEAGHALVSAALKDADPVQKVSVVSRGFAGGYTIKLPFEERRLKTRSEFLAELAVAFGGYVAEFFKFQDITTGSSSDIKQATSLAQKLVTKYGMSDKLGPRSYGRNQEMIFLGREITHDRDYSESVATQIDAEVNVFIQKAFLAAKKIVSTHKDALEAIAKHLMEKESIEHEEFYALIKTFNLKPTKIK